MSADQLKALEGSVAQLESIVAGIRGVFVPGKASGGVADDGELDSKYGDPLIRKDPKNWTGTSFVGQTMSQATPDYLDALAKYKDSCAFMSRKNGDPAKLKYADYDEKDAARARGWAQRKRSGWVAPKPASLAEASGGSSYGDDGADPFASTGGDFGQEDDGEIPFIVDAARITWMRP